MSNFNGKPMDLSSLALVHQPSTTPKLEPLVTLVVGNAIRNVSGEVQRLSGPQYHGHSSKAQRLGHSHGLLLISSFKQVTSHGVMQKVNCLKSCSSMTVTVDRRVTVTAASAS